MDSDLSPRSNHRPRAATKHDVGGSFAARTVYGLVTVLAVLQVMSWHPPSAWSGAIALLGTTLAVALLDAYADSIAEVLTYRRALTRDEAHAIWRDIRPVFICAQGPTVFLALAGIGLLDVDVAITLAQVVAFLFLFGYGWRVGQLMHEHWFHRLLSGLILVAIGGLVVGIKVLFH